MKCIGGSRCSVMAAATRATAAAAGSTAGGSKTKRTARPLGTPPPLCLPGWFRGGWWPRAGSRRYLWTGRGVTLRSALLTARHVLAADGTAARDSGV